MSMNKHVMFDKLSAKDFDIPGLKVIIFDFDNTLYDNLDWGKEWADFVLEKIEELMSFLPKEKVKSLMTKYHLYGRDGRIFEKAFNLFSSNDIPLTTKDFRDLTASFLFEANWSEAKTIPNELLRSLAEKYKLYIVSNSSVNVIKYDCEKLGIDTSVFAEIIQNRFDPKDLSKKGDYLAILEKEGVMREQALVIGDSNFYDLDPAKEIGLHTILLCGKWNMCPNMQRKLTARAGTSNAENKPVETPLEQNRVVQKPHVDASPKDNLQNKNFDQSDEILCELESKTKRMIAAFAPSARVSLGEMFGAKVRQNVERKIVSALKMLGFDDVFDIDFGADLTIVEESEEFAQFMQKKWTSDDPAVKNSTFFTSCCPAWVKFVQKVYPQFKSNISSCKSPQEITSTIAKTYYAAKLGICAEDIYFVSIMPCVAKKFERQTNTYACGDGSKKCYTDAVVTVREFGELLKRKNINLLDLPDGDFDVPMGVSSGAGVIFGTAGGVMESALRTLESKFSNGKTSPKNEISGMEFLLEEGKNGIREGSVQIAGNTINIAVCSGLAAAGELLKTISSGKKSYDFVEVMACAGGCVNGSGMPLGNFQNEQKDIIVSGRAAGLRQSDKKNKLRKSTDNPELVELYKNYLGFAGSPLAHKLLHTKHNQ